MSNLDPDPDRRDILEAFNARHRNLIQQEGFIHVRITEEKLIKLWGKGKTKEDYIVEEFKIITVNDQGTKLVIEARPVKDSIENPNEPGLSVKITIKDRDAYIYHDLSKNWLRADIKAVFETIQEQDPKIQIIDQENNDNNEEEDDDYENGKDKETDEKEGK